MTTVMGIENKSNKVKIIESMGLYYVCLNEDVIDVTKQLVSAIFVFDNLVVEYL